MKMFKKATALIMTLCMVFGVCGTSLTVMATGGSNSDKLDENNDGKINYVSFGASNVNGFGLYGYLPDEVYQDPNNRNAYNIYGYKIVPDGSYPDLLAKYFKSNGYEVELDQLAMSSMRAEEVRMMFDDTYTGDAYTEWRFTGGEQWFYGAGKLAYAELNGLEVNGHRDPQLAGVSFDEAIAALRQVYQNDVANAEVITWDVGINNFGVYLSGRVVNGDYNDSIESVSPEAAAYYNEAKAYVYDIAKSELGEELFQSILDMNAEHILDSLVYCLVAYCVNYDLAMEKIYELNPDVTVVNVSIQNLMKDLVAEIPGIDVQIPLGDIVAAIINAANTYMAVGSPYATKGYYANVSEDQHVTFFIDQLANYNGDPTTLDRDMIDCWRVYNSANMLGSLEPFAFDTDGNLTVGAGGQTLYEMQLVAIDAIAKYLQSAAKLNVIHFDVLAGGDWRDVESAGMAAIVEAVSAEVARYMGHPGDFESFELVDVDDDFWTALAQAKGIDADLMNTFAAYGVRTAIGNAFYAHPNRVGQQEICDVIIAALENETRGYDVVLENVLALVSEYYDDAYAFGYEYALENGYVDAVVEAIDEAIAAVNGVELDTLGLTAELEAEVAAELAEVVEALEAAKALVLEADVLDEATLNALVAALEEANDALAQVNAVLAQAGADVNNLVILPAIEAAQEYVETVVIPAVEKAVEEAIEAAKEAAKTAAEKAYEYLVEALGDAYDYLVEAIVDAVVTYMPVVDEMLYDYFYNNPEEVIEFVKTYGPYLVPVVEEYGDEALALVGYVLYTYGEDMAAFVIENHEEILAGFEAWADKYGERTAEMLQVYAEALGLCDAVREQIAELEAALEELKAELDKVTGEAKAAIEAEIAKIEAAIEELNAKVEAVIDALNKAVEDANAKVEDVIADIEAAIEDLKASVEELKANVESLINETLAAIREEIFAANRAVLEEVKALAEAILNKQIENLEDLVEALEEAAVEAAKEIKAIIDELVYEATHGEYVIENDSFYVALGDSSAVSESYVDSLAAVLGVDYANLANAGDTTTDTLALIAEQAETIAKADLVTVGYTANIFTAEVTYTMQNILMGDPVEVYDWVALVGENGAEYVEKALAEVRAKLVEEGLDIEVSGRNVADMLMACVEAYAYTYVAHVLTYPEIVNAIHEVAPEALVVIVGLHNTVENIVIDIEGTEIALGDYVQYAVDAANVISLVNAILVEDTVFVATPDVETLKEEKGDELTYDMISFVFEAILTNGADFATSEAGHAYIVEQILNALTIIDNRTGLLGDADSDGDVDNVDAMLVLQYDAALIGENDLDLTVCDVNGDGLVDNVDAMLILQYDALLIEVFPVEE